MGPSESVTIILASVGGSATVIAALSAWLGKVWANRILEWERASHARELELLKDSLELARSHARHKSEARFELYSEVWNRLQDVKMAGDFLWNLASREHLRLFVMALSDARVSTNKGRLVMRESHYRRLTECFTAFEQFQLGKVRLIDLRSDEAMDTVFNFYELEINLQIKRNGKAKQRYEELLEEVLEEFRNQLDLSA